MIFFTRECISFFKNYYEDELDKPIATQLCQMREKKLSDNRIINSKVGVAAAFAKLEAPTGETTSRRRNRHGGNC